MAIAVATDGNRGRRQSHHPHAHLQPLPLVLKQHVVNHGEKQGHACAGNQQRRSGVFALQVLLCLGRVSEQALQRPLVGNIRVVGVWKCGAIRHGHIGLRRLVSAKQPVPHIEAAAKIGVQIRLLRGVVNAVAVRRNQAFV